MILDHLLAGTDNLADLPVGKSFPDQNRNLRLFGGEALAGRHDCAPSRLNMAIASFTRLRPSRIPARRNRVRRCCLTVRGLIFSCPAISLLLQPCTSRFNTCWSRGVTLTCARSIIVISSGFVCLHHLSDECTAFANCSQPGVLQL